MQPYPTQAATASVPPHLHIDGETCPWCEQEIPAEKLAEFRGRIAAKERERMQAIAARMAEQHASALASALEQERREGAAREARAREEARNSAHAENAKQFAALRAELQRANHQKSEAEHQEQSLRLQLKDLQQRSAVEIGQIREAAEAQARIAAKEAHAAAQASVREAVVEKEKGAAQATARAEKAERELQAAQQDRDGALERQRFALERARDEAINAQAAAAHTERQKLLDQIGSLKRDLERKTNGGLGEGAEVVVYDALREAFGEDRIEPIKNGSSGADIRHVVISDGQACGTIIYDSKNHRKFLGEQVNRLVADRLAEKAEHAIISLHAFPAKASQLHVQNGVILANPARVVAVVGIIRQHLVQAHTLRLSRSERESKTAALYAFITSDRCKQLLDQIDQNAAALLDHQVAEQKWHQAHWEKQGKLLRSTQKVKGDLCREIGGIVRAVQAGEPPPGEPLP